MPDRADRGSARPERDFAMPDSRRFTALVRTRCDYTGESYRVLHGRLNDPSVRNGRIPDATNADQAQVESDVLTALVQLGVWTAHPLGIARVRPTGGGSVMVHLDSHTELHGGGVFSLSQIAVEALLPYAVPDGELCGVMGLRINGVSRNDLHLGRVGTNSTIVIRGVPGARWRTHIDERRRTLEAERLIPLWDQPSESGHERAWRTTHPWIAELSRTYAWLGSALLRRTALFHTASSAWSTRSWRDGATWVFEMTSDADAPTDHDSFLTRLTDPAWGTPMRVRESSYCSCDWSRSALFDRECTFELEHLTEPEAVLQLRFVVRNRRPDDWVAGFRARLRRIGADPRWIDRVLPTVDPDLANCRERQARHDLNRMFTAFDSEGASSVHPGSGGAGWSEQRRLSSRSQETSGTAD